MKDSSSISEMIQGSVEPGFELVREEFIRNFAQRGKVGAACAVFRKGEKGVDHCQGKDPHETALRGALYECVKAEKEARQ